MSSSNCSYLFSKTPSEASSRQVTGIIMFEQSSPIFSAINAKKKAWLLYAWYWGPVNNNWKIGLATPVVFNSNSSHHPSKTFGGKQQRQLSDLLDLIWSIVNRWEHSNSSSTNDLMSQHPKDFYKCSTRYIYIYHTSTQIRNNFLGERISLSNPRTYTSSHNHGSQKSFHPIVAATFQKYSHFPLPWLWVGLSPLPVIVEMKVYRDSLLKM